jgi:hypothetical protein
MAEWIEPIFDRTIDDVYYAIAKIEEWKGTEAKEVTDLKGCLNVSDINRIDGNIQYLKERLNALYYFPSTLHVVWDGDDLPDEMDINILLGSLWNVVDAYFKPTNSPDVPDTMLTYTQINDIEKILYLVKEMIEDMVASFRECGTFNCGEE